MVKKSYLLSAILATVASGVGPPDDLGYKTIYLASNQKQTIPYSSFVLPCDTCQSEQISVRCQDCNEYMVTNCPDQRQIELDGNCGYLGQIFEVELIATWLQENLLLSQSYKMKVVRVASECETTKIIGGFYENPLLITELISGSPASVTLGPFQDTVGNCGAREFSLVGDCLVLDSVTDQTVTLSLKTSENPHCTKAGMFDGLLNIKLREHSQVMLDLHFQYALTCQADLAMTGVDTNSLSYLEGGPDLVFKTGTWVQFPSCGYNITLSSNIEDEDWITFYKEEGLVIVSGLPGYSSEFNFSVTASLDDEIRTSKSFIWRLRVEEDTLEASGRTRTRALITCGASCASMCWSFDSVQHKPTLVKGNPDITWTPQITTVPAGCAYTVQSYVWHFVQLEACYLDLTGPPAQPAQDRCANYDLAADGKSVIVNLTSPQFTTKIGDEVADLTLTIAGQTNTIYYFKPFKVLNNCSITINQQTLANQFLETGSQTTFIIPAFSAVMVTCTDTLTCTSNSNNVVWSQSNQNFLVQSLGTSDVLGRNTVTLTCGMTIYTNTTPVSSQFILTIIPACSTTTIIAPDLTALDPIIIRLLTTNEQTITPQYKDTISLDYGDGTGTDLCGTRTCTCISTNTDTLHYTYVWYSDTTKLFTAKSNYAAVNPYNVRTGTDIVTLSCGLTSQTSVPTASVSLTVNIVQCSFTTVTSSGITEGQALTYSPLSPSISYAIFWVTSPSCNGFTYFVNMEMQNGSTDLSVFGGTLTGSTLQIYNLNPNAHVGIFNVRWYLTTTANIDQPKIYINFTVNITPCVVTTVAQSGDPWLIATTVNIFSTGITKLLGTFTQTPSCNLTPVFALQVEGASANLWSPAPSFFSLQGLSWTIQTQDYMLHNQVKNVRFTATFGTYVYYKASMAVTFVDPCVSTSLIAPIDAITNKAYFLSKNQFTIKLPWLNDSVNINQGTSSTQSICYNQSALVKDQGQVTTFGSVSQDQYGQTIYTIQSTDEFQVGDHLLTADFFLERYPTVVYRSSFNLMIYEIKTPKVADKIFQIDSPPLIFKIENFLVSPRSETMLIVYKVTLLNGKPLPDLIKYQMSDSAFVFIVFTMADADIAPYNVKVIGNFTEGTSTFETSVKFQVIVQPGPINKPPYFLESLGGPYILKVGQDWKLKLPEYTDPEGQLITMKVELDRAGIFVVFQDNQLKLFRRTDSSDIGNYTISVNLVDTKGGLQKNKIVLVIKEDKVEENIINERVQEIIKSGFFQSGFDFQSDPDSNWDWLTKYLKALGVKDENSKQEPVKPTVIIKQISILGVVELKFSKQMTTPPLEQFKLVAQPFYQNTTSIEQNTKQWLAQRDLKGNSNHFALQLKVIPGDPSRADNLTFSYNITEYKNRTMQIQLNFDSAAYVGASHERDYLQITFPAYFYIFDTEGQFLVDPEIILLYALPSQMQFGSFETQLVVYATDSAQSISTVAMVSNTVVNLLMSAALNQLFSMVESQQIIILMALFNIRMPANAAMFFNFMMQIASFDFIPMNLLYDIIFPAQTETTALNPNFDQLGISSMYLIYNLGSMILAYFLIPLKILLFFCLKPFHFYERVRKIRHWLWVQTFWSGTIKTIVESFTIVVMCFLINFRFLKWQDGITNVDSLLALVFGIFFLSFPIISTALLYSKFDLLKTHYVRERFGSLYEHLNLESGRAIIAHTAFYFVRRILIAVSVIFNDYLIIQVMVMAYSIIVHVIIVSTVKPFEGGAFVYRMEMFHEVIMMQILYTMICFTEFVPEISTRGQIGYYSMVLVSLHLGICFFFMLKDSYIRSVYKIRVYFVARKQQQMMQKVMSLKIARDNVRMTLQRPTIIQDLVQIELRMDIIEEVSQGNEESEVNQESSSYYFSSNSSVEVQVEPLSPQVRQSIMSEAPQLTFRDPIIDISAEPVLNNLDQLIEEIDKMVFFADKLQQSVIPPNEDNIFEDFMNEIFEGEEKKQGTSRGQILIIKSGDDEPQIPIFPDQGFSDQQETIQQSKSTEIVERKPKVAKQKLSFQN